MVAKHVEYRVITSPRVVGHVDQSFLSLTIDTSVLIGGRWWGTSKGTVEGLSRDTVAPLALEHPDLARWASALAPSRIRVGGTEADRISYGFHKDGSGVPAPGTFVLKGSLWERLHRWTEERGFELVFTVSAGPESRRPDGSWDPSGAERLFRNTARKGYRVAAWEFGNEVNAYPFLYGLGRSVTAKQYLADFGVFAELARRLSPGTLTVGPASSFWPVIGEPHPLIPALGKSPVAAFLDALTFHYYPQQSSRGPVAIRRAKETNLLNARALNGALRWVRHARRSLDAGLARGAPLWLTESGHALYGGEPGVSDTWYSTPWWLDQLGLLANAGVQSVFRQSLVGGDYGLLDEASFHPRPDYWASLLWKALMTGEVHERPRVEGPDRRLRAWHHSHGSEDCLLLINLHRRRSARVDVGRPSRVRTLGPAGGLGSRTVLLDGVALAGSAGLREVQDGRGTLVGSEVVVPPLHVAFVTWSAPPTNPI